MNSDMREYSRVVAMPFGDENVTTQLKNWFKRLSVRDEADSNGDSLFIVEESADDPVAQVIDHAQSTDIPDNVEIFLAGYIPSTGKLLTANDFVIPIVPDVEGDDPDLTSNNSAEVWAKFENEVFPRVKREADASLDSPREANAVPAPREANAVPASLDEPVEEDDEPADEYDDDDEDSSDDDESDSDVVTEDSDVVTEDSSDVDDNQVVADDPEEETDDGDVADDADEDEEVDSGSRDVAIEETHPDYESDDATRVEARRFIDELIPDGVNDPNFLADVDLVEPDVADDLPNHYRRMVDTQINLMRQSLMSNRSATRRSLTELTDDQLNEVKDTIVDQIVAESNASESEVFTDHFAARWTRRHLIETIDDAVNEVNDREQAAHDEWLLDQMERLSGEYWAAHPPEAPQMQRDLYDKYNDRITSAEKEENDTFVQAVTNINGLLRGRDDSVSDALSAMISLSAARRESQKTIDDMVYDFADSVRRDTEYREQQEAEWKKRQDDLISSATPEVEGGDFPDDDVDHSAHDDYTDAPIEGEEEPSESVAHKVDREGVSGDDSEELDGEDSDQDDDWAAEVGDESADASDEEGEVEDDDNHPETRQFSAADFGSSDSDTDDDSDEEGEVVDDKHSDDTYETIDDLDELDDSGEDGGEAAAEKKSRDKRSAIGVGTSLAALAAVVIGVGGFVWPGFFTGSDDGDTGSETSQTQEAEPSGPDTDKSGLYRLGDTLNVVSDGKMTNMRITEFNPEGGALGVTDNGESIVVTQDTLDRHADKHPEDFKGRAPDNQPGGQPDDKAPGGDDKPAEE